MSALPSKADTRDAAAHICQGPIADIAPSELARRFDRLLADRPLSMGPLSEYPTDYFVGICIETSAMAEQNTLRLP
jgi:hypothetical protein